MLHTIAAGLTKLQAFFGRIPIVVGKGECAQHLHLLMRQLWSELEQEEEDQALTRKLDPSVSPRISELLLIDRDVDLVTPLCTELTYEGMPHNLAQPGRPDQHGSLHSDFGGPAFVN